jgi:Uma2 family endonuclease
VSYEAFLESCDEDTRAEWTQGAVEIMSPSSGRHQEVLHFLIQVLGLWIRSKQLGIIRSETFLMRLAEPVRSARLPDLFFVARHHLERLKPTVLEGPADLAVEIISAESVGRDRGDKFVEYEQAGITEYWLLDPEREQAEFYELGGDGRYRLVLGGRSGEYRSRVLEGFTLDLEWLWQDPKPNPLHLLRELGVLRD